MIPPSMRRYSLLQAPWTALVAVILAVGGGCYAQARMESAMFEGEAGDRRAGDAGDGGTDAPGALRLPARPVSPPPAPRDSGIVAGPGSRTPNFQEP
jgi:hypothetical protein